MYKIITDSCGELTPEMIADPHFAAVPLTLQVDDEIVMDDESFDQASFLNMVAASKNAPKSGCPSPEAFISAMEGDAKRVYIVTLSANLSGSYGAACLAKDLFLEEHEAKDIYVFNSCSASIGQTLICLKIEECEKAGMSFAETVDTVEKYIASQHTYFVLDTLDVLRKSGRLSSVKAMVAGALHIKPVMAATEQGTIIQAGQTRGMSKAIEKMAQLLVEVSENCGERIVAISHVNCVEKALELKSALEKLADFKDIFILDTRGVSTMYACDGGLIVVA